MALVSFEEFALATSGSRIRGGWYTFWHRDRPSPPAWPAVDALELVSESCHFAVHRHRSGARKVRRILRRAKQAWLDAQSAESVRLREGQEAIRRIAALKANAAAVGDAG